MRVSQRLVAEANKMAKKSLDDLYATTRKVLDKAKLGKIDAVIGQKRKLDIEVSDERVEEASPILAGPVSFDDDELDADNDPVPICVPARRVSARAKG